MVLDFINLTFVCIFLGVFVIVVTPVKTVNLFTTPAVRTLAKTMVAAPNWDPMITNATVQVVSTKLLYLYVIKLPPPQFGTLYARFIKPRRIMRSLPELPQKGTLKKPLATDFFRYRGIVHVFSVGRNVKFAKKCILLRRIVEAEMVYFWLVEYDRISPMA